MRSENEDRRKDRYRKEQEDARMGSNRGALDLIEEHLQEDISTEALAQSAGLSPFYFQRLFKRLTGRPVLEYVKMRRLAMAASALADREKRILDVAVEYGFSSHAAFTRAFKEATASRRRSTGRTGPCSIRVISRSCP